jgi:hypothetical protein
MFGAAFTLSVLLDTIKRVRPETITIGAHTYVQLAEAIADMDEYDEDDLDSVIFVAPVGSAVPQSCQHELKKKFRGLRVS